MHTPQLSEELGERIAGLKRDVASWAGTDSAAVCVVRSPYRFCPLGAHVDHQQGQVLGFALDHALLLGFARRTDPVMAVKSRQFPGTVEFTLGEKPGEAPHWVRYAVGAAAALKERYELNAGITAVVDGHTDVGGLSSSAAVGVAYLLALEDANDLRVGPQGNVELDRIIENDHLGLRNGILDQSMILLGEKGCLTHLDCRDRTSRSVPLGTDLPVSVVVLFSGVREQLGSTDYNLRVGECNRAAGLLLQLAGAQSVGDLPVLRDVRREWYDRFAEDLPPKLRKRARHFFEEQRRVRAGTGLWAAGDLEGFGRLITESGWSSVRNYECGCPPLKAAFEALAGCPGVYGARFSGAGFRGCCAGLAEPGREAEIADAALARYLERFPDMAGAARVYFCASDDGAGVVA